MKNPHLEGLRRKARTYHRNHQWPLKNGLFIPHVYEDDCRDELSWWDDVGFILNGRRVIVNWVHPRSAYRDAMENVACSEVPLPAFDRWPEGGEKRYRKQGHSRKKVIGIVGVGQAQPWADYYAVVSAREIELCASGIELDVRPSMRVTWANWATVVDLVAPIEVRSHDEVVMLAALAKRLLKRETTVTDEWPGYIYGQADWLAEAGKMMRGDKDSVPVK